MNTKADNYINKLIGKTINDVVYAEYIDNDGDTRIEIKSIIFDDLTVMNFFIHGEIKEQPNEHT